MKSISLSLSTLLVGVALLLGCGPAPEHALGDAVAKLTAKASPAARKKTLDLVKQGITDETKLLSEAEKAADAETQKYRSDSEKEHQIIDNIKDRVRDSIHDSIRNALRECTDSARSGKEAFGACINKKLGS